MPRLDGTFASKQLDIDLDLCCSRDVSSRTACNMLCEMLLHSHEVERDVSMGVERQAIISKHSSLARMFSVKHIKDVGSMSMCSWILFVC